MAYRGWVFGAVLSAFGCAACADTPAASLPNGVVARVNGVSIPRAAVTERMWREWGPVDTQFAIRSLVVRAEAERRGISVTPAELQDRMVEYQLQFNALPGRQPKDWDLFIKRFGRSYVEERQRDELLSEKIGAVIAAEAALTPDEEARVRADLQRSGAKVRARHILVGIGTGYGGRTEAQAEARAREALEKLASGTSWDDAAREYSDDVSTRESGGDLGFFTREQMVEALEKAAFAASPDDPPVLVRVPEGWTVLQVTDRKQEPPTEEQIQAAMKATLDRKKEIMKSADYWYPIAEKQARIVVELPWERP